MQTSWLYVYRTRVTGDQSFALRDHFFAPVTLTFIHELESIVPQDISNVRKCTSYVKAFESYHLKNRQTTEIIYHAALRVVNNP